MADIIKTLEDLAKKSSSVDKLTKSLSDLNAAKKQLMESGDVKQITHLNKLRAAIDRVKDAELKRLALEKELQKAATEDEKVQKKLLAQIRLNNKELESAQGAYQSAEKSLIAYNQAIVENWKNNTIAGKAWSAATGQVASFISKLGFLGMAYKAIDRYTKAAEIRNKVLIQSYRGLQTNFVDGAKATLDWEASIRRANATAIRLGISTEEVGDTMAKFNRITGSQNPESLATLTQGALAVSKSLGIDTAEAVDYVSLRMSKFGGSAASAISSLNELRTETESTNNAFGRTVLRGDDIARTLLKISRETTIYALDQRFISGVLRENITRLQAMGESYDQAYAKATAFTEGLTGQAPEWMKILAGEDLFSDMMKGFDSIAEDGGAIFQQKFGAALDKAKPGLSKKVAGILADTRLSGYEKSRLIQELTSGTEVGMEAMNEQLLRLADSSGLSVEVIAKQMGVTRDVANDMIGQARAWKKDREAISALEKDDYRTLMAKLGISEQEAKLLAQKKAKPEDEAKRVEEIKSLYKEKQKLDTLEKDAERREKLKIANAKKVKDIQADIDKYQKQLSESGDMSKTRKAALEAMIKNLEAEMSSYSEASEGSKDETKEVGKIVGNIEESYNDYSMNTGKEFKAQIEELSSIQNVLAVGVAAGLGKILFSQLGGLGRIERILAGLDKSFRKSLGNFFRGFRGGGGSGGVKYISDLGQGPGPGKLGKFGGVLRRGGGRTLSTGKPGVMRRAGGKLKGLGSGLLKLGSFGMMGFADTGFGMDEMEGEMPDLGMASEGVSEMFATTKNEGSALGKMGGAVKDLGKQAPKAGYMKSLFGKVKNIGGLLKGSKGLLSIFKKFGGIFGKVLSLATMMPGVIENLMSGNFKAVIMELIPLAGSVIGGAVGSILGSVVPGAGTIAGGIGGSLAGDWIGTKIAGLVGGKPGEAVAKQPVAQPKTIANLAPQDVKPAEATKPEVMISAAGATQLAAATQAMAAGPLGAAPQPATTATTGGEVTGEFVGGVQSDGSIMMKVTNFGSAYAGVRTMERTKIPRY